MINPQKIMLKHLFLFFTLFSFAQKPISVSELSKMSNAELADLYLKKDSISKVVIADFFLTKAKKENKHRNIVLGYLYKSQTAINKDITEKYLDSMVSHSKLYFPNSYLLSYSYYSKANFFFDKRKYDIALNNYILANKFLNKNKKVDEQLYYCIQFTIAVINSSLLNYKEALPLFLEFYKYSLKLNGKPDIAAVFAIAVSYNRLGNLKLAKYYTEYGKRLSLTSNDKLYYDRFLACTGANYFKEKKYNKGILLLKKILHIYNHDPFYYSLNSFYIGKSYLAINNKKMAVVYFKKVDSVFVKEKNTFIETIESYKHLIDYYKEKKDPQNQLLYTNNLIKADSTLMSNFNYLTKKMHTEYDIPELIKNKESLIDELKIEKKYYLLFFLVAICGVIFFFIGYRKKQKQKQLEQKEAFEKYKQAQLEKYNNKEKVIEIDKIKQPDNSKIIQDDLVSDLMLKLSDFEVEKRYLDKDCTLDKVAKEMNTNTTYLSKVINDKKGVNFSNYINGLRIEYAVDKLENDTSFRKYNMKGIADLVGFNNADSFARAFKLQMNMKPTFFIDSLKNNQL
jgi:AraC-like DNA-binding protein